MNLNCKVSNIQKLIKFDSKILFSSGNCIYTFNDNKEKILFLNHKDDVQYIEVFKNNRIILNEKCIYNGSDLEIQFNEENQSINSYFEDLILKDIDFENEKINFYRFYLNKEKARLHIDHTNIVLTIFNDVLVYESVSEGNSFIEFFNLLTKKELNKISINDLLDNSSATIYGNPVVVNNKLFIYIFDKTHKSNDKKTVCFDINNGKLLWENDALTGWLTVVQENIFTVKSKKVQVLNSKTFELIEINLEEKLSALDYKISDEANGLVSDVIFSLSTSVYKVYNNHLYFSQEKGNIIGIIDLIQKKLVWHTKLKISSNGFIPIVTKIEFLNNTFYALDSGSTLHVYENEILA